MERFEDHKGLVQKLASEAYMKQARLGLHPDWSDVYSDVCLAFVNASRQFKPELGFSFSTYFSKCVRTLMIKATAARMEIDYNETVRLDAQRGDDNESTLHDALGRENDPTAAMIEREAIARAKRHLDNNSFIIASLLRNPPPFLVRELRAVRARDARARAQGLSVGPSPASLSLAFVMDVMRVRRLERTRIRSKLEKYAQSIA